MLMRKNSGTSSNLRAAVSRFYEKKTETVGATESKRSVPVTQAERLDDYTYEYALHANRVMLVVMDTDWCRRCASVKSHLKELESSCAEAGVRLAFLNVESSGAAVAMRLGCASSPGTVILFKDGKEVRRERVEGYEGLVSSFGSLSGIKPQ